MPISTRWIRSLLLTIPTSRPLLSTTGTELIRFWIKTLAISCTDVFGATEITSVVMTCPTLTVSAVFLSTVAGGLSAKPGEVASGPS